MTMVNEKILNAAQIHVKSILEDVSGVVAVVIATTDGFDIASAVTQNIDPARVAALASSISAIGVVVSQEVRLGRSRSITINTDAGFAFLSVVDRLDVSLVLNIIANEHAILGQIAYRSGQCVKALEGV
jgi:predicted regulator of Ras-like GTPase activity (Roadblock/LC7/MglB family)